MSPIFITHRDVRGRPMARICLRRMNGEDIFLSLVPWGNETIKKLRRRVAFLLTTQAKDAAIPVSYVHIIDGKTETTVLTEGANMELTIREAIENHADIVYDDEGCVSYSAFLVGVGPDQKPRVAGVGRGTTVFPPDFCLGHSDEELVVIKMVEMLKDRSHLFVSGGSSVRSDLHDLLKCLFYHIRDPAKALSDFRVEMKKEKLHRPNEVKKIFLHKYEGTYYPAGLAELLIR